MVVYVVQDGNETILSIWSTREGAESQAERLNGYFDSSREFCVDEYEVNV